MNIGMQAMRCAEQSSAPEVRRRTDLRISLRAALWLMPRLSFSLPMDTGLRVASPAAASEADLAGLTKAGAGLLSWESA